MDFVTFVEQPTLHRPAVVCAFKGWNDGGEAASVAARYLLDHWDSRPLAYLDPEEFFDFQVTRPTVELEAGVTRVIHWPRGEFALASPQGRDVVVFTSQEPNVRWRTFVSTIVETARSLGSELLVTLGAFLTDVPHSREVPVVGSALDRETAESLGLRPSEYEGPTGVPGVLHDASNRAGLPSVSLWAAVPHYLPSGPNPKAALALVGRVSSLLGTAIDTAPLARAAARWEEGVGRLLEGSDELTEYVQRLEQAIDENAASKGPVASADEIAEEVERYLREQGTGPG